MTMNNHYGRYLLAVGAVAACISVYPTTANAILWCPTPGSECEVTVPAQEIICNGRRTQCICMAVIVSFDDAPRGLWSCRPAPRRPPPPRRWPPDWA
jgi:hypothetical protein